ncbi:MAG: hypothetical protein ABSD89_06125 [Halobacteriota archaeon]|jgi:hypothetical protein
MNYTKPEITSLASASSVIKGESKKMGGQDSVPIDWTSVPAYEGDE